MATAANPAAQDGRHRLGFRFHAVSLRTHPGGVVYRHRLQGHESEWHTTRAGRAEYEDLPLGEYAFEVRAVDRDLRYSEPMLTRVSVVPDPRITALTDALGSMARQGDAFVGKSAVLVETQRQIAEVAGTEVTVLITGETGTGKGLAARTPTA